jgi:Cu(I)/Ag(I) efflux system membrane fusion protein
MKRSTVLTAFAAALIAGTGGGYWVGRQHISSPSIPAVVETAAAADRVIIYYRDPSGAPYWSAGPKKDSAGRDYLPVYDGEDVSFDSKPKTASSAKSEASRRILYYRNPMGLPDTSPVPKKDSMGMDYIPVFEDEAGEAGTVKVSLDKIQRSGVRTEVVQKRAVVPEVRGVGTVAHDETRLAIVTTRSDGFVEDLFVDKTGQHVKAGQPLFRLYSSEIQRAQADLLVARAAQRPGVEPDRSLDGPMQKLRNLGVPESRIQEIRRTGENPRTLDWPSPMNGDVIVKRVINGQRVAAGEELYRIADHSHVWVIADISEADLPAIPVGSAATVTVRAYPSEPIEGIVTFIYPELRAETRTARIRIELPNPGNRLKMDMYADVVFHAKDGREVTAVPSDAVIDSGTRQVVLVAKGEGRFEPRSVKLGRRGLGYVEVLSGVREGEEVVTAANFLIDAESNLKTALQSFTQSEKPE